MVSKNPNPVEGFYLDPNVMALPGLGSFATTATTTASAAAATSKVSMSEDPSKKIRKPYTITKSRESWTEPEHDKFLEALQLFDRDWKKIEAFIGSKTVIQIRSHAQKYFLKVQKNGIAEHLPPPRPKRKAAHPYPQKASKNAPVLSQVTGSFQSSSAQLEPGLFLRPDSSSMVMIPLASAATSWTNNVQTVSLSDVPKGPAVANNRGSSTESTPKARVSGELTDQGNNSHPLRGPAAANNRSSSTESTPKARVSGELTDQGNNSHPLRVLPDFAQVYTFIGSVFDPVASGHLQKLKNMDPIDVETVLLLMRNLSINLRSPDFEDHRRMLSSYEIDQETTTHGGANNLFVSDG